MPGFDPTSAMPVQQSGGFDPTTAKLFDPTTAQPAASAVQGNPLDPHHAVVSQGHNDLLGDWWTETRLRAHNALESARQTQTADEQDMEHGGMGDPLEPLKVIQNLIGGALAPIGGAAQAAAMHLPSGRQFTDPTLTRQEADKYGNLAETITPIPGIEEINSAVRGVRGAVSSAAARLLDSTSAIRKSSDVAADLTHTTGVQPAPFVQNLFETRGVDTTPASDPRPSQITPMTTDHIALNAADHAQYQQLLQTGNVDDIKNFFKSRNGPQPSWSSVNRFVEQRDNPDFQDTPKPVVNPRSEGGQPFNYNDQYNQQAENDYNEQHRQAVEDHINNQMEGWRNAPSVEVVHSPEDIADPEVRAGVQRDDPNGNALGVFGSDGQVHIFSGRITDPATASAVIFHEGLGHFGLSQLFGDRLNQTLISMADRNVSQFGSAVDARQASNPGESRALSAEEVLAQRSQKGVLPQSWRDGVTSAIRQFGRKMGLNLAYNDAEVNHILAMAHDAVVNGKPDVRANGFRGAIQGLQDVGAHGEINGSKFMRASPELKEAFAKLPPEAQEDWKQTGHRDRLGDWNYASNTFDRLSRFTEQNKHLLGTDTRQVIKDFEEQGHPLLQEVSGKRLLRAMSDTTSGPGNAVTRLLTRLKSDEHTAEQSMNALHEAKSPGGILENMPDHLIKHLEKNIDENGNLPPRMSMNNKFITRSQLNQATSADYHSEDPERVFKALTENYHKESISVEDTRTAALANGINLKDIRALAETNPGELASRTYRLGAATNIVDARLQELESRIGTPAERATDKARWVKAIADFNYLAPRFKGETSEAARTLNIAKAFPQYTNASLQQISDMLREHGEEGLANLAADPESLEKFMKTIKLIRGASGSNPVGLAAAFKAVNKPYWEQYLTTIHMNMMLSAASTHIKAPVDMSTGIARNVIEKTLAMPIGKVRQMLVAMTGKTPKPGVELAELANHIIGLTTSISDGEMWRQVGHAVMTGESSYVIPKIDQETGKISSQATPTQFANQFGALSNPRIPIVSKPTDLISAQDTFFRSVEMNAQLLTVATREARDQLGPKASTLDVMAKGRSLALDPTPSMLREAFAETNRTLLLNDNPLNTLINRARTYRPGMNIGQRIMAFVASNLAPFIRVESNSLINRIIQRSPLALIDPTGYTQAQLKAGGAKADIAVSKILYGTVLLGMYWEAADKAKDLLTGAGPDNVDKYKEKLASGWRPNAVHENGQYNTGGELGMSVNPFDTHNKTAQMVASMRQAYEAGSNPGQVGAGLKLAMGSLFSNLSDISWVSDIQPIVDALTAHGQEGQSRVSRFASGEAGTWLPNGLNQVAKLGDPVQRDTTAPGSISGAVSNTLEAEVPGLRHNLSIKYSVYGDPLANGASISGVHTWIPGLSGNGTTETTDPAERELDRLGSLVPSAIVTPVQHVISADPDDSSKGKITLSPAQFEEYQRLAGKTIVYQTQQDMDSGAWSKMSDLERIAEVRDIEKDAKKDAAAAIREAISHQ